MCAGRRLSGSQAQLENQGTNWHCTCQLPGTTQLLASQFQLILACFPAPSREGERQRSWDSCVLAERKSSPVYISGTAREQVKGQAKLLGDLEGE
jgi:hypothetical protein